MALNYVVIRVCIMVCMKDMKSVVPELAPPGSGPPVSVDPVGDPPVGGSDCEALAPLGSPELWAEA